MKENSRTREERKFWSKFAPRYDTFMARQVKSYGVLLDRVLGEMRGDWTVLEVAAGTGQITLDMAARVRKVCAVDITPEMIAVAQKKSKERNITNVEFTVEDAYALSFAAGRFDAVVCTNALHNMKEPQRALGEMRRVLKRSGTLITGTFCHGQGLKARMLSGLMALTGFPANHRFTTETLTALIKDSGFVIEKNEMIPDRIPMAFIVGRPKS